MSLFPDRRTPGTPNVAKCLGDAVDQGRLSREQAEEALAYVKRLMDERPGTSEGAAAAQAAAELKEKAELGRRQAARQILVADARMKEATSHPDGMTAGVAAIAARDITGKATYGNLEGRIEAIRGELHARVGTMLDAYRTKTLGLTRDTLGLRSFVAELYGETTGDGVARASAMEWNKVTEYVRARFNAAGGNIKRLEHWRMPRMWVPDKVKRIGQAEFTKDLHDAFASGELKIVDWETGDAVDALRRAEIISQSFETISTDGFNKFLPGRTSSAKLANARQERRAFEFTSAAAELRFNEKYGVGDAGLFDMLVGHLDGMARDVAMLEKLGPNPEAMIRLLIEMAVKAADGWAPAYRLQNLFDHVTGAATSPVSERFATFMRGTRAWLTSTHLGSAFLNAPSDFATMHSTAALNGLSTTGMMSRYLSLMNPTNAADRLKAVRAGLIADAWSQRAYAMQRQSLEEFGTGLPTLVAEVVLRGSGQNAHVQSAKWAFGLEFLDALADRAGKKLTDLEPEFQRAMQRYGIDEPTWNTVRANTFTDEDGMVTIWPEHIASIGRREQEAVSRIMEMVNSEARFASPEPDAVDRALTLGSTRPGTFIGEFLVRNTMLFKSFPVTMLTRHVMRGMGEIRAGDRGRYMVGMVLGMTVMAAFSLQLRALLTGKDPRDVLDASFWGAAFLQGGGAGILGDFLNSSLSRDGRGFIETLAGPVNGLYKDLAVMTVGNLPAAFDPKKESHFGRELGRFVQRYTPGSTLWYSRLALDRLLWDRVHELLDPEWNSRARQIHRQAMKERNQEFFWGPNDGDLPSRGPNLRAAWGAGP
jgi:hypothetical protein